MSGIESCVSEDPWIINHLIPFLDTTDIIRYRRINKTWNNAPDDERCSYAMNCVIDRDYGNNLDKNFKINIGEPLSKVCIRLNGSFEELHFNIPKSFWCDINVKYYVFDTLMKHQNARLLMEMIEKV